MLRSMVAPPAPPGKDKGIFATLAGDVGSVFGGKQAAGAHRVARRTLTDLEEFYLTEEHRKRLARAGIVKRFILRLWWLFKGLVLKLSPARRLMLALGLFNLTGLRVSAPIHGTDIDFTFPNFGLGLVLLVLALELRDKLVAHDELETGRTIQRALMPSAAPVLDGWDIWLYTQSANEVSGDLVDALTLGERRTALLLADVAGKGLSAALLSAKLQATVRAFVVDADDRRYTATGERENAGGSRPYGDALPGLPSLGDLGERVNHIMYRDGVRGRFATMVCLLLTSTSGAVRLLNAGHMAPLVLRAYSIEELPRGSVALGMVPVASYEEQAVEITTGDTLVVYSDGVTEAMNGARDFFGDDQLRAVLNAQRGRSAAEVGQAVVEAVTRFVGEAPVHDDVSLVVVRRTK